MISSKLPNPNRETRFSKLVFITYPVGSFGSEGFQVYSIFSFIRMSQMGQNGGLK